MTEEERKEEKRWSFLAHHPDGFLAKCTDKHAIPAKAVPIKPNWIWRTDFNPYYFFVKGVKIPRFLTLLYQSCVMHPFPADKRTWSYSRSWFMIAGNRRWRHWHLPPYPYPLWEEMEFKGMDVQPFLMVSCQSSAPDSIMINANPPPGACVGRSYCFSWRVTIVSMCNRSPPTFLRSSGIARKMKQS